MLKILAIAQGTLWKKERKDCGSKEVGEYQEMMTF